MTIALVWFRHDLRLSDNPAFIHACSQHDYVIPLYIFDQKTSVSGRAQAWWLHHSLVSLSNSLAKHDLSLVLRKGKPFDIILALVKQLSVDAVYWNRCYEPLAIERDKKIKAALIEEGILVQSSNGNLLNEPWTIKNKSGDYFKVFTAYWKNCRQMLHIPPAMRLSNHPKGMTVASDKLDQWKLLPKLDWAARFAEYWLPGEQGAQKKLDQFIASHLQNYKTNRDFPAKNATSHLSPHLHFGEISPWTIWRAVELAQLERDCDLQSTEHFLSELGWREFSTYLLYHFPQLAQDNFRSEFDHFPWRDDKASLIRWQKGMTGYPLIDAGMRELWVTGYMHNRIRMVVASFLTKGLLIDWRVGADWFLDTLVDADLANNSASWQWVAGCGADAAPYFRIFNPVLQSQKFDPNGHYIRQWIPELAGVDNQYIHQPWINKAIMSNTHYPEPIIDHNEARNRALSYYHQLKRGS
ncbi:cryptochrome/photolyase family protein [Legionella dresdenensis]|uniref:Cryptochrome/photolyase family protein n=1 Tax=Legionella dresdenensis TaxID=450200 RepID=A0ABV8CH23_9GAMM